jgi:hypothetical protein
VRKRRAAELPQPPTNFAFLIKAETSKAFGLEVPLMLLARADEMIE